MDKSVRGECIFTSESQVPDIDNTPNSAQKQHHDGNNCYVALRVKINCMGKLVSQRISREDVCPVISRVHQVHSFVPSTKRHHDLRP